MRFFIFTTVLAVSALSWMHFYPEEAALIASRTESALHTALDEKRVELSGLERLSKEDVRVLLPMQRNNLWWFANSEEIANSLKRHPVIETAKVSACPNSSWYDITCYALIIRERPARFVAVLGEESWLVGADGVFIAPVHRLEGTHELKRYQKDLKSAIFVSGLGDSIHSPEVVKAKLQVISSAVDTISSRSRLGVSKITFFGNDELEVIFKGLSAPVTFQIENGGPLQLAVQTERLNKIIADLRRAGTEATKIDLAFDNLAVVKLNLPENFQKKSTKSLVH